MLARFDRQHEPDPNLPPRTHPYSGGVNPGVQHYDFLRRPDLIPHVLEDFVGHSHIPAVQRFYRLLEWVNGPDSVFESDDSRLTDVRPNGSTGFLGAFQRISGVMILLRDHELNYSRPRVAQYVGRLLQVLSATDREFEQGLITATYFPVAFVGLPIRAEPGRETMMTCWAFGDTEEEVMANMERCYGNLAAALKVVSDEIRVASATVG